MKQLLNCLEEEVSVLREILSNLKIEENALISRDQKNIEVILTERGKLQDFLKKTKEGRKKLTHEFESFKDDPAILTLIEQVESLEVHITKQQDENTSLRQRCNVSPEMGYLLREKPVIKKKRPLLLDEENS